jgi:hypothetical protein
LKKSFLADERKFLGLLTAAAEMKKINFREIFGVVRFSTFATVSAQSGP